MKKMIVLTLVLGWAFISNAQNTKVVSAFNYLNNKQLDLAKENIDAAALHDDTKDKAKTWFYMGNIYLELHLVNTMTQNLKVGMKKEEVLALLREPLARKNVKLADGSKGEQWNYDYEVSVVFANGLVQSWKEPMGGAWKNISENALQTAYDAYQKTLKLDEKKEFSDRIKLQLFITGEQFYNLGVEKYNKKNYAAAIDDFEKTISINNSFGIRDSSATFNAALSAEFSRNYDKAKKFYNNLIQMNYRQPLIYTSLANIYKNEKDTAKALKVLQQGRKNFPNDYNILISETNIYLAAGKTKEAQELLQLAVQQQPNNENLYFAIGANYNAIVNDTLKSPIEKENAFIEAEKAYIKAIEIKPDYFDANYNLGALYVNKASELTSIANRLDLNDKRYNELKSKADDLLKLALPRLEKAIEINDNDIPTMYSLREIYIKLQMYDKLKEINQKISSKAKKQ